MNNSLRGILNQIFKLSDENVVGPPNFLAPKATQEKKKKKTKRKKEIKKKEKN